MPALSIVIPTYNTAAMTLRCCQSVLGSGAEVIVADDGSTDGTAELLAREVPDVRVVRLETNRGFAGAANRGVESASAPIILLLNSDAVPEPGAPDALLTAFEDPRLGVAGAQLLNEDRTEQWSGGRTPTLAWIAAAVTGAGRLTRRLRRRGRACREVDWVSGAAIAFRREVWTAAGPLTERYHFYCQDIDFCLRAREAGWDVRIVPEARVIHGLGKTHTPDPKTLADDLLAWGTAHYGRAWGRVARIVVGALRRLS
jgi:GT2 family glycosyltransferase